MSASPAPPPSGPNSVTPTTGGPPAPVRRKKNPVNIFNTSSKKRPAVRKPAQSGQKPAAAPVQQNGPPLHSYQQPMNGTFTDTNAAAASLAKAPSEPDPSTYDEYTIRISKSQLMRGKRYHAMKLQSKQDDKSKRVVIVDPYDEKRFIRPVRLHRRYARDKMEQAESEAASGGDDKERELMNIRRAERQAEREENQKLIAPTGGESGKPLVKKKNQKKVEEGRDDSNPIRKKRQQLRYEEARPWHLEDFEGKNVWVGSYEEALSELSIMLEVTNDGAFHMVPIEKWYKFSQTNKVNAMDSDEVEKFMHKKTLPSKWGMGTQAANDATRREQFAKLMAARKAARDEDDDYRREEDTGEFQADRDMLDLDVKDEFQDDDEGMLFQGEDGEDAEEIERRLYLEMRDAGLGGTGVKDDDQDVEGQYHQDQLAKLEEKKKQKKLRKQLKKREHQGQYSDDSESDDPYVTGDDSMDSEEEREEEKRKEEAKKTAQLNGDKSGASSKGTNTPNSRPEKKDQSRLGANLKRPGSPDVSDLSGNESSRKKQKSINGRAVSALSGGARSLSPDAAKPKVKVSRSGGAGSGSDTDTSRKGRPTIKLKNSPPGSPKTGTPNGSRAGSPAAPSARIAGDVPPGFPTLAEVKAAIPATGIATSALVQLFKNKVAGKSSQFIALVKAAGVASKDPSKAGLIVPRP